MADAQRSGMHVGDAQAVIQLGLGARTVSEGTACRTKIVRVLVLVFHATAYQHGRSR